MDDETNTAVAEAPSSGAVTEQLIDSSDDSQSQSQSQSRSGEQDSQAQNSVDSKDKTPLPNTMGEALKAFESLKTEEANPFRKPEAPLKKTHPDARNYEGLTEEERIWFRDMKGSSYDKLYPFYLQAKKAQQDLQKFQKENEELKKSQFFEQDGAWTLTPEYKELAGHVDALSQEASYWQEQLALIEAGQPWKPLMIDNKGNYHLGDPQDASPQSRAAVMSFLNKAQILHHSQSQQLNEFGNQFKSKHQGVVSGWKETEAKIFQGADQDKLNKAAQTKLSMFPAHMHGDFKVQTLAKALVVIEGLLAMVNSQKSNATTQQIKNNISAAAGPTKSSITTGANTNGQAQTAGDVMKQFHKAAQRSYSV